MVFLFSLSSFLIPIVVIVLLVLVVGALGLFSGYHSTKKAMDKHTKAQETLKNSLKNSGFCINQHFELLRTHGYADISFDFFVDTTNKQIAIHSYQKKNTVRFDFKELKSIKILVDEKNLGNTLPNDVSHKNTKKIVIVISTHKMLSSGYKIELSRLGEVDVFWDAVMIKFIRSVSNTINDIISSN